MVNLWIGAERFGDDGITLLASCNSLILGLLSLWSWYFAGTGTQARLVIPTTLAAGINFLVSII
jgi:hypothetical protein